LLGYPDAALADTNRALEHAREIGHPATLMYALFFASFTHIFCGGYAAASAQARALTALAEEKGALYWRADGMMHEGFALAFTGQASNALPGQLWNHCVSVNGILTMDALELDAFGEDSCGARSIR
jgi:hypothetical protein